MKKVCPWCGRSLQVKRVEEKGKIKEICSKCDFKLKEYEKFQPKPKEEKPNVVEIKEEERPVMKEKPTWPIVVTIIAIVIVIILLLKIFLL